MTAEEKQRGIAEAAQARAALYDTLGQLEVRLNYAQRIDDALDDAKERVAREKRERPVAFAAAAVAVAGVVGLAVWGVATWVIKRV